MLPMMNPNMAGPFGTFSPQQPFGSWDPAGNNAAFANMGQFAQMQSAMMQMFTVFNTMMMMKLMQAVMKGAAVSAGNPAFGGGASGGSANPTSNFLGGSSSAGGASSARGTSGSSSGTPGPGVQGALDKARSMLGLQEGRDRAKIQEVTGKSGINPATTPWCAAFAMNILKDSGVLDLSGLSNRNYCPTIVSWAKDKGIWGARGSYQPKPGDAIMFDWGGDGTSDHIGIVEKVENGKVITIEGNSSNSVKRNSYALNSGKIMGYVIGGKKHK